MHLADSNANNYLPFASEAVILVSRMYYDTLKHAKLAEGAH